MGKCLLWVNVSWLWSKSSWSSSQLFNFSLSQNVIGQVLTWSTYNMVNLIHQKIDFAHNIIYNWIYPTTDKSRTAYIHNCLASKSFFENWLCTKHLLYLNISHLRARQGPQTKAQLHISIYVWPPNQFLKIDFAHNIIYNRIYPTSGPDRAHRHKLQNIYPWWMCTVYFMSVGPVGPGGGIYSIIEDVVCKVYLQKTDLEPNNSGYMQFCFSVSGPCRA